ncbi:hypothetical protein H2248_007510 [Termitomyces sp. 'cryptogamus']|nr:hypothetical protein H2248_007510 [Termitomyces sp. 'cryptogamus']
MSAAVILYIPPQRHWYRQTLSFSDSVIASSNSSNDTTCAGLGAIVTLRRQRVVGVLDQGDGYYGVRLSDLGNIVIILIGMVAK